MVKSRHKPILDPIHRSIDSHFVAKPERWGDNSAYPGRAIHGELAPIADLKVQPLPRAALIDAETAGCAVALARLANTTPSDSRRGFTDGAEPIGRLKPVD